MLSDSFIFDLNRLDFTDGNADNMKLKSLNGNDINLDGLFVDEYTRCEHYHTDLDIIALKFKCCNAYYPCYQCHEQLVTHETQKFNVSAHSEELVILCGYCKLELTFSQYSKSDPVECMNCHKPFNCGCKAHYNLYFEM